LGSRRERSNYIGEMVNPAFRYGVSATEIPAEMAGQGLLKLPN
jgi:hypothetical protein